MADPYVVASGLSRSFDASEAWLNRFVGGRAHRRIIAVRAVSFSITKGATYALVGESGSGKSTIARMLVGLLPPDAGSITVGGEPVFSGSGRDGTPTRKRRLQMVFQDPSASLNARWRVGAIIAEPLHLSAHGTREATRVRVRELLGLVGLAGEDAEKFPYQFSGGQRQRISIARALAAEPEFLVCDEPTSALDVSVQAQILNLLRDLQAGLALTCLFISHDLAVVRHISDRVGVLYFGSLVEECDTDRLFDSAKHPYSRMLLDSALDLDHARQQRTRPRGETPSPLAPPSGCAFHPRCPKATALCRQEAPRARQVSGHLVACHWAE